MKTIRLCAGRACLALYLLVASAAAHADSHEYACKLAARKLGEFQGASVTRNQETFVHDRKSYRGCVIKIEGKAPCEPEGAMSPWWGLYPSPAFYPSPEDGWSAHGDGWKLVREKDSREDRQLFYHVARGNVFCLVESNWDGSDRHDPDCEYDLNAPTGKLRIVAKCALAR
jgi:hypothetical protein